MKFSIIIPAHNEEKYIEKTINSIQEQNFKDYEVIIVANGCTDKTLEAVKKYSLKNINLKEANVSKARNIGAKEAKGEILIFLDADTHLNSDCLEKINTNFTKKYSVATTKVLPDNNKSKYRMAMHFKNFYNATNIYHGCSGILICRKEDFIKVGGYQEDVIVKEHRILTNKLKEIGKYKCLPAYVTTSMRRFEQWGLTKATWFWVKQLVKNYRGNLNKSNYEKIR